MSETDNWTTFVQWKGTDLCMDFTCPECGGDSHFDGFFAYNIKCPHCNSVFKMPTDLALTKLDAEPKGLVLTGEAD